MSTGKWSWLDEILRMAESTFDKPPATITELLDMFDKVVPPEKSRGWTDVTDSPRDTTPPPPASPATGETTKCESTDVMIFTCPACHQDVHGTVTIESTSTSSPTDPFDVTTRTKPIGMRVAAHDCMPA